MMNGSPRVIRTPAGRPLPTPPQNRVSSRPVGRRTQKIVSEVSTLISSMEAELAQEMKSSSGTEQSQKPLLPLFVQSAPIHNISAILAEATQGYAMPPNQEPPSQTAQAHLSAKPPAKLLPLPPVAVATEAQIEDIPHEIEVVSYDDPDYTPSRPPPKKPPPPIPQGKQKPNVLPVNSGSNDTQVKWVGAPDSAACSYSTVPPLIEVVNGFILHCWQEGRAAYDLQSSDFFVEDLAYYVCFYL